MMSKTLMNLSERDFGRSYPQSQHQGRAKGTLFEHTSQVHCSHGRSVPHESSPCILIFQRFYAAMDAVQTPATGQVVCVVSMGAAALRSRAQEVQAARNGASCAPLIAL